MKYNEIDFNKKTILITGGAGFIGSALATKLIKCGHHVFIIDNLSTGKRENIPQESFFIEGDCADSSLLSDLFNYKIVGNLSLIRTKGADRYQDRFPGGFAKHGRRKQRSSAILRFFFA